MKKKGQKFLSLLRSFLPLVNEKNARWQENVIKICNAINVFLQPALALPQSLSLCLTHAHISLCVCRRIEEAIKMSLNCKKFCLDFHYFIAYFFGLC